MRRPTYYLWKDASQTQDEFELQKRKYIRLGFRVVIFQDGKSELDINNGLKELIKNHIDEV